MRVSVIVLADKECEDIERIVEQCLAALIAFPTEVIVVADPSLTAHDRHNTCYRSFTEQGRATPSKQLQPLVTGRMSRVRILWQNVTENRAAAMVNGFQRTRHSYWIVVNANHHHFPEKLPVLVHALADGAEIVLPSRERRLHAHDFGKRSVFTVLMVGLGVSVVGARADILSGCFAIRRDIVETTDLDPWGYTILIDLLVKNDAPRIDEIPVTTDERREQHLSWTEYQIVVEQMGVLFCRRFDLDRFVTPVRAVRATEYAFIGGIGTVINMIVFAGGHLGLGIHYLLAGILAFVIALNWNFLGNWAFTFDRPRDRLWNKYWKFIAVSLGGLALYSGLLTISITYLHLPALVGNGIAIGGAAVFNFLGAEMFAFAMSLPE